MWWPSKTLHLSRWRRRGFLSLECLLPLRPTLIPSSHRYCSVICSERSAATMPPQRHVNQFRRTFQPPVEECHYGYVVRQVVGTIAADSSRYPERRQGGLAAQTGWARPRHFNSSSWWHVRRFRAQQSRFFILPPGSKDWICHIRPSTTRFVSRSTQIPHGLSSCLFVFVRVGVYGSLHPLWWALSRAFWCG